MSRFERGPKNAKSTIGLVCLMYVAHVW